MDHLQWIEKTAWDLLDLTPPGVAHFRLLRDVLKLPVYNPLLEQGRLDLYRSRRIAQLTAEQYQDCSWGRFHSRDARVKQVIPTTEIGVYRGICLGLEANHPILSHASSYILDILQGRRLFPDRSEKNDRWQTGVRLFLAATLTMIIPDHPELDQDRALWLSIAQAAFQSGRYQALDEIQAHAELTGVSVKGSYLVLNGKYQLTLLGSQRGMLTHELELALLHWLWDHPDGIGYLGVPRNIMPPLSSSVFERWLASWELLAHSFLNWAQIARQPMQWLLSQRSPSGFWDFGPCSPSGYFLPLSDNLRISQNRRIDWTTRILILLRQYRDDQANF